MAATTTVQSRESHKKLKPKSKTELEVVADAEPGTQGETDGARGEAVGGHRALTPPGPIPT
jgi:hypothetical protein